ncbi:MAG: hypothetical protein HKN76_20145 [Saprospiraceae bacterium]|nr:hypothetical protein [Saprospiraceae bacterium]
MRDYYSYYSISPEAREKWLSEIIDRLKVYDDCLNGLKYTRRHLKNLHEIINAPFHHWEGSISPEYFKGPVNLRNPANLRELLSEIDYNLGLDIKRYKNFPVYFLFRYKKDSYLQHFVLLEEIYCSPQYPNNDHRFLRLRSDYGDRIFLNAIPYRDGIPHLLRRKKKKQKTRRRIDFSLNRIAEILNLAWDEDFELTRRICAHLKIRHITEAMELTHLILSVQEYSWLRERPRIVNDFFEKNYEHPYLAIFLKQVEGMDGRSWTARVDQAKKDYIKMKVALSGLFKEEVISDKYDGSMPLWKCLFVFHNKSMPEFEINEELQNKITKLEAIAGKVLAGEVKSDSNPT